MRKSNWRWTAVFRGRGRVDGLRQAASEVARLAWLHAAREQSPSPPGSPQSSCEPIHAFSPDTSPAPPQPPAPRVPAQPTRPTNAPLRQLQLQLQLPLQLSTGAPGHSGPPIPPPPPPPPPRPSCSEAADAAHPPPQPPPPKRPAGEGDGEGQGEAAACAGCEDGECLCRRRARFPLGQPVPKRRRTLCAAHRDDRAVLLQLLVAEARVAQLEQQLEEAHEHARTLVLGRGCGEAGMRWPLRSRMPPPLEL